MSETEALQNEIEQLKEQLAKREDELQMAGTIGKQLLHHNEESNEKIQELENELDVMREKMGTFASLGLEQAMKKLKDDVARSEKEIQNEKERYRALQEEHHEYQVREEVLRSQLREAESFTATLQNTSGSLKEAKEKMREHEDLMEKIERENKRLKEEIEEMKNQKKSEEEERKFLTEEMRNQSNAAKTLGQQKAALEAENRDLKSKLEESQSGHKGDLSRKVEDLKAAKIEAEKAQVESSDYKEKYAILEKQLLHLVKENQMVSREKEEIKQFLDEALRKVKHLQAENEENDAASSLVEELEAFSAKTEEKAEKPHQESEEREEYFFLTVAAVRVALAMKSPAKPSKEVDSASLFEECCRDKVPFHEWHDWLREELGKDMAGPAPIVPQRQHGGESSAPPPKESSLQPPSIFQNISKALFD